MRRLLGLGFLSFAVLLLAIPAQQPLVADGAEETLAPGHVPLDKVQLCHKGDSQVITVSENALSTHLRHGDCQLPACDFNNVYHTEDSCDVVAGAESRCVLPNPRDPADGVTSNCPVGRF